MHANPLPSVGSDGTFLACPPGSLVVSRGLIGGVALASTDTTIGGVLHWFALAHKHHLMDVALAESYGWVKWWPFKTVSRKKKSKPKPKAKSMKGKEKAGEEDEDGGGGRGEARAVVHLQSGICGIRAWVELCCCYSLSPIYLKR